MLPARTEAVAGSGMVLVELHQAFSQYLFGAICEVFKKDYCVVWLF